MVSEQPQQRTSRSSAEVRAPPALEDRVAQLENQVTFMQTELRITREELQNLLEAIHTAHEDFQRAATRIATLEFEWTVWNTGGDAPEERHISPSSQAAANAGLITQQLLGAQGETSQPLQLCQQCAHHRRRHQQLPLMGCGRQ